MLDPEGKVCKGAVPPPNQQYVATQCKTVTVYGNYAVQAGQTAGALLWLPQCGCNFLRRMNLFAKSSFVPVAYAAGLTTSTIGLVGLDCNLLSGLFIPVESSEQISQSPPLADDFTLGRLYGGILKVMSDATSTTSAAMSGTFSAGAVNDTRTLPDFQPPQLIQQSRVYDGIQDVRCQNGIATILATDIAPLFSPISFDATSGFNQASAFYDVVLEEGQTLSAAGLLQAQPFKTGGTYAAAWISPYASLSKSVIAPVAGYAAGVDAPLNFVPNSLPAYPDQVMFEIDVLVDVDSPAVYPQIGTIMFGTVTVIHYYVTNSTVAGLPQMKVYSQSQRLEAQDIVSSQYWQGSVPTNAPSVILSIPTPIEATSTTLPTGTTAAAGDPYCRIPQRFVVKTNRPKNTLWLGSIILTQRSPGTDLQGGGAGGGILTGGAGGPLAAAPTFTSYGTYTSVTNINFFYTRMFENGLLGPARIIRWDNLAAGQNVLISGTLFAELVPGGTIAAYYKSDSGQRGFVRPGLEAIAAALFNGASRRFRRVYTLVEYELEVLQNTCKSLTFPDIAREVAASPQGKGVLEAAGMWDSMKSAAKKGLEFAKPWAKKAAVLALKRGAEYAQDRWLSAGGDMDGEFDAEGSFAADGSEDDLVGQGGDHSRASGDWGEGGDPNDPTADGNYDALAECLGDYEMNKKYPFNRIPKNAIATLQSLLNPGDRARMDTGMDEVHSFYTVCGAHNGGKGILTPGETLKLVYTIIKNLGATSEQLHQLKNAEASGAVEAAQIANSYDIVLPMAGYNSTFKSRAKGVTISNSQIVPLRFVPARLSLNSPEVRHGERTYGGAAECDVVCVLPFGVKAMGFGKKYERHIWPENRDAQGKLLRIPGSQLLLKNAREKQRWGQKHFQFYIPAHVPQISTIQQFVRLLDAWNRLRPIREGAWNSVGGANTRGRIKQYWQKMAQHPSIQQYVEQHGAGMLVPPVIPPSDDAETIAREASLASTVPYTGPPLRFEEHYNLPELGREDFPGQSLSHPAAARSVKRPAVRSTHDQQTRDIQKRYKKRAQDIAAARKRMLPHRGGIQWVQ